MPLKDVVIRYSNFENIREPKIKKGVSQKRLCSLNFEHIRCAQIILKITYYFSFVKAKKIRGKFYLSPYTIY